MTDTNRARGVIYYDAECILCTDRTRRFRELLASRGFDLAPLQTPGLAERLQIDPKALLDEMRLVTPDGKILGGANVVLYVARFIWWAKPLRIVGGLRGGRRFLQGCYRRVAVRRNCAVGACKVERGVKWPGFLPLACLPLIAAVATANLEPWILMWALAGAIYLGCKYLTWWEHRGAFRQLPFVRSVAYLSLWPGMDPGPFLVEHRIPKRSAAAEWIMAGAKTVLGAFLLWGAARCVPVRDPLVAGWVGMFGIIFLLHFGTFHLLALALRAVGVPVSPIMKLPIAARSLGEFWGLRWNRGFNDLAYRFIFNPVRGRIGAGRATLLAFLVSGLIHELVISLPARGGYGLPTLYFLLQGLGLLAERTRTGRRVGLRRGVRGRLFALTVAAGPAYWLFHPMFVLRVIIPFLGAIHSL